MKTLIESYDENNKSDIYTGDNVEAMSKYRSTYIIFAVVTVICVIAVLTRARLVSLHSIDF